ERHVVAGGRVTVGRDVADRLDGGEGRAEPEDRVVAVEPVLRRVGDVELAASRVRSGRLARVREGAGVVGETGCLEGDLVAGTATAVPEGVAALDDEIGDDAVEQEAVVEAAIDPLARRRVAPGTHAAREADEVRDA